MDIINLLMGELFKVHVHSLCVHDCTCQQVKTEAHISLFNTHSHSHICAYDPNFLNVMMLFYSNKRRKFPRQLAQCDCVFVSLDPTKI
jgi:hypothetical protein